MFMKKAYLSGSKEKDSKVYKFVKWFWNMFFELPERGEAQDREISPAAGGTGGQTRE